MNSLLGLVRKRRAPCRLRRPPVDSSQLSTITCTTLGEPNSNRPYAVLAPDVVEENGVTYFVFRMGEKTKPVAIGNGDLAKNNQYEGSNDKKNWVIVARGFGKSIYSAAEAYEGAQKTIQRLTAVKTGYRYWRYRLRVTGNPFYGEVRALQVGNHVSVFCDINIKRGMGLMLKDCEFVVASAIPFSVHVGLYIPAAPSYLYDGVDTVSKNTDVLSSPTSNKMPPNYLGANVYTNTTAVGLLNAQTHGTKAVNALNTQIQDAAVSTAEAIVIGGSALWFASDPTKIIDIKLSTNPTPMTPPYSRVIKEADALSWSGLTFRNEAEMVVLAKTQGKCKVGTAVTYAANQIDPVLGINYQVVIAVDSKPDIVIGYMDFTSSSNVGYPMYWSLRDGYMASAVDTIYAVSTVYDESRGLLFITGIAGRYIYNGVFRYVLWR